MASQTPLRLNYFLSVKFVRNISTISGRLRLFLSVGWIRHLAKYSSSSILSGSRSDSLCSSSGLILKMRNDDIILERWESSSPVGDGVVTEDIWVGVDTSTVDITVNHQVLGQGEHDALSKETSCKNKHKSERFLPFLFTNTLFTEVPVTDGHVLHQKIFTKVDEVHSVGSPPSPSGVSPVKCFLAYFSSSSLSNPPLLTFMVRFACFFLCIVRTIMRSW